MYTDDQMDLPKYSDGGKMPIFLKVLLILTSIAVGFGLLSAILAFFMGPIAQEEIDGIMAPNLILAKDLSTQGYDYWALEMEKITRQIDYTNQKFYLNQTLAVFAYSIGLVSVWMMSKGKKIGFHLYIIYDILAFASVYFIIPISEVSSLAQIVNGIITGIYIFMYSRNLHWLTK